MRLCVVSRLVSFALSVAATPALGGGLTQAPPPFAYQGKLAVPVDIKTLHVEYVFNVDGGAATATARMTFRASRPGLPVFDLVPNPTAATLDGATVDPADVRCVDDPDSVTRVRVLAVEVDASADHELVLEYSMNDAVTFAPGKARVGFFMWDLTTGGREFLEQYAPANFEFDTFDLSFDVRVLGDAVEHEVFANGDVVAKGPNAWSVTYPSYFTSSSPYFHLADKGRFVTERFTYVGVGAAIPVTVYSEDATRVRDAVARTKSVLAELETAYGAFAHSRLVAYITPSGGGMEYAGATMTSLSALGHEITHSWFARGLMPADGNAGWIDEAVASWRDNGYPRANSAPDRAPVNLGGFSPYRRHTTYEAYGLGAKLISELDYMFRASGGMKPLLRRIFTERQRTTITVPTFQTFLEGATDRPLAGIFDRYVYGKSVVDQQTVVAPERASLALPVTHPRPYTREEVVRFR
jgi:hypothetical protein